MTKTLKSEVNDETSPHLPYGYKHLFLYRKQDQQEIKNIADKALVMFVRVCACVRIWQVHHHNRSHAPRRLQ